MFDIQAIIQRALAEDLGPGDITSSTTVALHSESKAEFLAKEDFILAGLDVARETFRQVDPKVCFFSYAKDGDEVKNGDVFACLDGPARSLLQGERVALNFLQRLSGIATHTRRFVEVLQGTAAAVVDTRKTTPGLRVLEKYAVRVGGGRNHRFNLADGILIKENHILAAGGITAAVASARKMAPHTLKIEIETQTLAEVREALEAGADIILLDNMPLEMVREAVKEIQGRALVEASGGVALDTVRPLAEAGVDFISVGALTHSSEAVDISLLFSGIV
ncbi:MAG: carboxylating nicotinate-nucleotide diphosphorylase [Deltaproteobacteria bacterium]|nr:carboxylating nicotinate-nucleotide diphosphorylase [Deltaproteobacteria bacterium]